MLLLSFALCSLGCVSGDEANAAHGETTGAEKLGGKIKGAASEKVAKPSRMTPAPPPPPGQ
jgi:hypothetical protein